MRKFILVLIVVLGSSSVFSQVNIVEKEQQIKSEFDNLVLAGTDSLKLSICNEIERLFADLLKKEQSFDHPFSELSKMGKLTSPDQKIRIFNWNCVLNNGSYRYFGLLQIKLKKSLKVVTLKESKITADLFHQYTTVNWPGALYYQIISLKTKSENSYFLLGWDGNNVHTNKKLIEVLNFDEKGQVTFGMPLISWKGKTLNRVVFEYAKQARMTIRYNEKEKRIVFDHLAPSSPIYRNQFEYYGPDFSYDALEYQKGKWVLVENVDVRNK